jgi:hypothetical protein
MVEGLEIEKLKTESGKGVVEEVLKGRRVRGCGGQV